VLANDLAIDTVRGRACGKAPIMSIRGTPFARLSLGIAAALSSESPCLNNTKRKSYLSVPQCTLARKISLMA
jgi:hypothetical protein